MAQTISPAVAGAALARQRKRKDAICEQCEEPFSSYGGQTRYCTPACRSKAYYYAHLDHIKQQRKRRRAVDQAAGRAP